MPPSAISRPLFHLPTADRASNAVPSLHAQVRCARISLTRRPGSSPRPTSPTTSIAPPRIITRSSDGYPHRPGVQACLQALLYAMWFASIWPVPWHTPICAVPSVPTLPIDNVVGIDAAGFAWLRIGFVLRTECRRACACSARLRRISQ
ncbi:hypothetical protein PENSPDRAFT_394761 [Peniophora sp. CONT]|nr:hypothetical protein PENSPDRAFT_394761 [Peniophora sp. CONT]